MGQENKKINSKIVISIIIAIVIIVGIIVLVNRNQSSSSGSTKKIQQAYEEIERAKENASKPVNITVFADNSKMYEFYQLVSKASTTINDLNYYTRNGDYDNLMETKDIEDIKELFYYHYDKIDKGYDKAYKELTTEQKEIQIFMKNLKKELDATKQALNKGIINDSYDMTQELCKQKDGFLDACKKY